MAGLLAICITLPLIAAITASRSRGRSIAIGALSVTLALLLGVLRSVLAETAGASGAWLIADELNAVPMVLFAAIALVTVIAAPRRDMNLRFLESVLILTSSTLTVYAAANHLVFLGGWIASVLPFIFTNRSAFIRVPLVGSVLALTTAVILIGPATEFGVSSAGPWALGLLVLAAILREHIVPFHRATVELFDDSPMLLATLLVNSHLGVFLIARMVIPAFPGTVAVALPWLGGLALFASLYTAVLGMAERAPRRILAMLIASQSSAILAGLATTSHEGIAGALIQWIVLAVSSTMLIVVYRSLEARIERPFLGRGFMGLASRMPRLAVFFAISGLTLVGLPGTLGFAGEDLLLHGVLARYPWWGAALPVAIALNAYHAFRLFAHLFLGKDEITHNTSADALPRERWALSACLAFLVWGGLVPRMVVALQAPATAELVRMTGANSPSHP
jgi:NADH-quinone oxidoreductase subunit M